MKIDPKKINFDETKPYEKSEGGNMKEDFRANKNNYDRRENAESVNKNETLGAPTMPVSSPGGLNQAIAPPLQKPTELLSKAWELYRSKIKTFLGIVVIPMLLVFFAAMIFFIGLWILGLANTFGSASFVNRLENFPIIFALFIFLLLIFISAIIIIQIWSQTALVYAIKEGGEIGVKEAYQKSKNKIKSFFWVSLLAGFITIGGFMLFAIPGIIFGIWFSFAVFIVITEDLKGMDAILKSREYVRNYWWPVFWRFLFINIVMIGVMIVVAVASMLIPLLADIVSIILTPLIMIYTFLIYDNLRKTKGDFEFKPSAGLKKKFIAIGVLGFIIIPLLLSLIVLVNLNSARDKALDTTTNPDISIYDYNLNDIEKETPSDSVTARDLQRELDLKLIFVMVENYKMKTGSCPLSHAITKLNGENSVVHEIKVYDNTEIPVDPKDPEYYYGYQSLDGESFELTARLENIDDLRCDLEIKENSGICIYKLRN